MYILNPRCKWELPEEFKTKQNSHSIHSDLLERQNLGSSSDQLNQKVWGGAQPFVLL